jgi:membrane-bound metal-dependent hydrolase YbcI (DUF457 family)
MPLPIGHTAIAAVVHEYTGRSSGWATLKRLALIALLANLPDIDMLFGLLVERNAQAFHRGPTHSLVFALLAGWLVSRAVKDCPSLADFGFRHASALVLSHVVADALLTPSPVSFFWPLQVHWSLGVAGWFDVVHSVIFESIQDIGIVAVCMLAVIAHRLRQRAQSIRPSLLKPAERPHFNQPPH